MMKLLVLVSLVLIAACVNEEAIEQDRLMQNIERQVQLPAGSLSLRNYARYYARDGERVIGAYILDSLSDERLDLAAGQRRWVKDRRELPMIFGGGCSVIGITYLPEKQPLVLATCNGDY